MSNNRKYNTVTLRERKEQLHSINLDGQSGEPGISAWLPPSSSYTHHTHNAPQHTQTHTHTTHHYTTTQHTHKHTQDNTPHTEKHTKHTKYNTHSRTYTLHNIPPKHSHTKYPTQHNTDIHTTQISFPIFVGCLFVL